MCKHSLLPSFHAINTNVTNINLFFFLINADVKDHIGNYLYNTIHYLFSYIYIFKYDCDFKTLPNLKSDPYKF